MARQSREQIPQVLMIVQPSREYMISLTKKVRDYMGLDGTWAWSFQKCSIGLCQPHNVASSSLQ